jgi:hypothetical protein
VHLHAVFIPPDEVRRALVDLVARQEPAPAEPVEPTPSRGLFRRSTPEPVVLPPSGPLLDIAPADRLVLPVTDFGYVTSGDARRLGEAVERACAELPGGPSVRVSGGAALIDPQDRSVWADLAIPDEDLDSLRTIAQAVVSAVEPLGYFCDRRRFRPRLAVATINDATTAEHLEQVLAALSAYESEPWTITEVSILQRGEGVWRAVPVGG